jgi:hypothetical protein|eukprot:scaffold3128_cov268-Alexandrium_tamarense.AAC.3
MKLSSATLLATLSTASAFTANNGQNRLSSELFARQPIMAGNWKVRRLRRVLIETDVFIGCANLVHILSH